MLRMDSQEYQDVLRVRHIVTFAEAVFTVWLGALHEAQYIHEQDVRHLCLLGAENGLYKGFANHNPLEMDVTLPKDGTQAVQTEDEETDR
jgi:hypothetical protein